MIYNQDEKLSDKVLYRSLKHMTQKTLKYFLAHYSCTILRIFGTKLGDLGEIVKI